MFTAGDRLYRTTEEVFRVVACSKCRLMRLSPHPPPSALPRYYPPAYWYTGDTSTVGWFEEVYRRLVLRDHVHFVERAIRESGETGAVLDVGCGGGLFLGQLSDRRIPRVGPLLGLDFSLDAAVVARSQRRVNAVCATLSAAPLPGDSCAAVTMFHVLEHLYDPRAYLDAAHRLLRPDGRLVVQVPNADCWQFLIFGESWNGLDVPRHLFNYRAGDIDLLLDACGFEVLRRKHFSLRDNPAGLATTLVPGLDPVARQIRAYLGIQKKESQRTRLLKDIAYLLLIAASLPLTAVEAACRAGATIMVEARKKS
ncbi:MAG: class I SAM-dependent methyltransferase [Bryobacteraceae bacterium]